jgi:hypothetical protein
MKFLRAMALAGLFAVPLIASAAGASLACSCEEISEGDAIFSAAVVFVGTPRSFEAIEHEGETHRGPEVNRIVRFEVDSVLTGAVGAEVEISVEVDGQCGTPYWGTGEEPRQEQILVVAYEWKGTVSASGCTPQSSPSTLATLLESPLPAPTSTQPIALVVPLREKWASVVALDAAGEVVAWGSGESQPRRMAACPDSAYVVESLDDEISVRNLATMEVESRWSDGAGDGRRIECLTGANGVIELLTVESPIQGDETRTIKHYVNAVLVGEFKTDDARFAIADRTNAQVLLLSPSGGEVGVLDIATMQHSVIEGLTLPPALGGAWSPDGTQLAVATPVMDAGRSAVGTADIDIYDVSRGGLTLTANLPVEIENLRIDGLPGRFMQILWSDPDVILMEVRGDFDMLLVRMQSNGTQLDTLTISDGLHGAVVGDRYVANRYYSIELIDVITGQPTSDLSAFGARSGSLAIPAVIPTPPEATPPLPQAPELRQITDAERAAATTDEAPPESAPATTTVPVPVTEHASGSASAPGLVDEERAIVIWPVIVLGLVAITVVSGWILATRLRRPPSPEA